MSDLTPESPEAVGLAIAARREELGLSRKELAARSGLSYSYVANIESGYKQPSAKVLHALAQALDLRPADLLERADAIAAAPAEEVDAARSGRSSWFRGGSLPRTPDPTPTRDEVRAWVREAIREELALWEEPAQGEELARREELADTTVDALRAPAAPAPAPRPMAARATRATPMAPMAPMAAAGAAPEPLLSITPPDLPPDALRALPRWLLSRTADLADLAIRAVVFARLRALGPDPSADDVTQAVDATLTDLADRVDRHRGGSGATR